MNQVKDFVNALTAYGIKEKDIEFIKNVAVQIFTPEHADIDDAVLINRFSAHLHFRQYSDKTIDMYQRHLKSIAKFSKTRFVEMRKENIMEYLEDKHDLAPATMNSYISTYQSFFAWMMREDYITVNPMLKIERVKEPIVLQEAFTPVELERMRAKCESVYREDKNHRNRALVEFMLSSMCRTSEISSIKIKDVNFAERSVRVVGKGNKERKVYYDAICEEYLNKYLESRKPSDDEYLFTSLRTNNPLSRSAIYRVVSILGDVSGVMDSHPHKFRRTGASEKNRRGASVTTIKELLGHSNISTTSRYIVANPEAVHAEYIRVS